MANTSILLIEDEPSICDNIIFATKKEGFAVLIANTGNEGLVLLKKHEFSLVILDVGLPDISGFEVCKEIRKNFSLPIIFLTGMNAEIDRVLGLELGADDYVSKPFSSRELMARIKTILRRCAATPSAKELNKDEFFVIDDDRYQITLHGKLLELSRYEFLILHLLLKSRGKIYSRNEMIQLIWDEPLSSFDRTIDTHIKTIRSKIKDVTAEEVIKTHRGIGYSLVDKFGLK
jgi:two-component system catabolic regulation response regulator CreB